MNRKQRRASGKQRCGAPGLEPALPPAALGHHQAGRLAEAEALYRQVLAVRPRHPDALHLLGVVAHQTGRHDMAVRVIGQAILAKPNVAMFHSNLGNALLQSGRPDDGIASLKRAVELDPALADGHYNLALALQDQGRLDEAALRYQAAASLRPAFAEAHDSMGTVFREQGRLDEAIARHRAALSLQPTFLNALSNLGTALKEKGRLDDAADCYLRSLAIDPAYPEGHYNLGVVLQEKGWPAAAAARYRRAIDARPSLAEAHFNLAMVMLLQGKMDEGWCEYEWRWKTRDMAKVRRGFAQPLWNGEAGGGRTLLIHAEQGLGDTLQFCRYAPLAAAKGFNVVFEAELPLARVLRSLPGIGLVVTRGQETPAFDVHCPALSLPLALGTTLETVPGSLPYLHADAAQSAALGVRVKAAAGEPLRVGLAWAGNPTMKADLRRSLSPDRLQPLLDVAGAAFFSLQKDVSLSEGSPMIDLMGEMRDFADTAALVDNLDLVISVDTAVAHLAAAMGKPVWLLNRFDSCWRWLLDRRDSPWYPTMRIYRQPVAGDWDAILAEVGGDLSALVRARRLL